MSTRQSGVNTELEPGPQTQINTTRNQQPIKQPQREYDNLLIYTDGAYHHHREIGAIGFVLQTRGGDTIYRGSEPVSSTSSMESEAKAMRKGIEMAQLFNATHVMIYTDCNPLKNKINGEKPIKKIHRRIKELLTEFEEATIFDIPRNRNEEADDLASLALRKEKDKQLVD